MLLWGSQQLDILSESLSVAFSEVPKEPSLLPLTAIFNRCYCLSFVIPIYVNEAKKQHTSVPIYQKKKKNQPKPQSIFQLF